MAQALFINRKDLVKFTSANGNIDTDRFIQYIFISQEIEIQRILGTDLYEVIETKITGGTLAGNYLTLVSDYIKQPLCHWAMVEALPFLGVKISNNGIYRTNAENSTSLTSDEINDLVEKERNTAQYFSNRLIDYLTDNASTMFPEYYTNSNGDISPDDVSDFGGWEI